MVLAAGALTACGGGGGAAQDSGATAGTTTTRFSAAAMLGEKIFVDTSLSASGRQACASCHVPQAAHGADNARPVQPGGSTLELEGQRSSPSLRYLAFTPPFQIGAEGRPSGGFFWDGRAATLQQQAGEPLLGRTEMANESAAALAARLARTAYAAEFKALYGADILQRPDDLFARITLAMNAMFLRVFHA